VVAVSADQPGDLDGRVPREQSNELRADVAGRAHDGDTHPFT
jgi:hypothetical protein